MEISQICQMCTFVFHSCQQRHIGGTVRLLLLLVRYLVHLHTWHLKGLNKQFEILPDCQDLKTGGVSSFKSTTPTLTRYQLQGYPCSTSSLNPLHCPAQYAHSTTSNVDTTLLRGHRHDRRCVLRHYGIHGQKSSLH